MSTANSYIIDVRSDTVTKPTDSMRRAMATAQVGDDVFGEDPTVNELEKRIAAIMGKEAALFVLSGTMGNLISIMVHCSGRGEEVIVGDKSHIFKNEQAGPSQFGGVMISTMKNNDDGTFDLEELQKRIRGDNIHEPRTRLIAVENTHNFCGGKVVPISWLKELNLVAKRNSLLLHMDGSRLFNAATYLNMNPSEIIADFDSVSICFSKALGAPLGSAIAGSADFIKKARRMRKALGGGLRQVGVVAAPILVGLDEVVPALIGDHRRAATIANAISSLRSSIFSVDARNVHTNIIMVHINEKCNVTADKVVERLMTVTPEELAQGCVTQDNEGIVVKMKNYGSKLMRIMTHFEISDTDMSYLIKKITIVFKSIEESQPRGFWN